MIQHVVLIRWKPETGAETIAEIRAQAQILLGIDGVQKVVMHENLGLAKPELGKGFGELLIVTMRDEEALAEYGPHALHAALGEKLLPAAADLIIVDYLCDQGLTVTGSCSTSV